MSNSDVALGVAPGNKKGGQACPTCPYTQQRSGADHRMFRAVIDVACRNWPHDHPFQPNGVDDQDRTNNLYGYLLVEAGYVDTVDVESHDVADLEPSLNLQRRYVKRKPLHYWRLAPTPSGWQLITPRSLDYESAGKRTFEAVRSKVYEIIEVTLGRPIETLKTQRAAA